MNSNSPSSIVAEAGSGAEVTEATSALAAARSGPQVLAVAAQPARWSAWAVLIFALFAWQLLSATRLLSPLVFPAPLQVLAAFQEAMAGGRLLDDIIASLFRVGVGLVLAALVGIPMGLWLGLKIQARAALLPGLNFLRSLSPLAWIPFAIAWFGIGDVPAMFLIFMSCVFPLALSTLNAVESIPKVYFRVAQDFGLRGANLLWEVALPAITPQIVSALRVTTGVAWLVVVAAEMLAGRDGLGFLIWDARNGARMDLLVVGMITIGVIGVLLDRVLLRLTRWPIVRWGYER